MTSSDTSTHPLVAIMPKTGGGTGDCALFPLEASRELLTLAPRSASRRETPVRFGQHFFDHGGVANLSNADGAGDGEQSIRRGCSR